MGECPVCAAEIELANDAMSGELIVCDDCGAKLEIVGLDPVMLNEAPSAEEDGVSENWPATLTDS